MKCDKFFVYLPAVPEAGKVSILFRIWAADMTPPGRWPALPLVRGWLLLREGVLFRILLQQVLPGASMPGTPAAHPGAPSPACGHLYRVKPVEAVSLYRRALIVDREDCEVMQKVVIFLWKLVEFLDRRNICG